MRLVLCFLFAAITAFLCFLDNPALCRQVASNIAEVGHGALYDKAVSINDLHLLERKDVQGLLPQDRSIFWWLLHGEQIEAALTSNPMISEARVETCGERWYQNWGCFRLKLKERMPEYATVSGEKAWLIGENGTFLAPMSRRAFEQPGFQQEMARLLGQSGGPMRILQGIFDKSGSPELAKGRVLFLQRAVKDIERGAALRVQSAELLPNQELSVRFAGFNFPVIFAAGENQNPTVEEQAGRFKRLSAEFGPRISSVRKVDLAFNKIGVVELAERAKEVPQAKDPQHSKKQPSLSKQLSTTAQVPAKKR